MQPLPQPRPDKSLSKIVQDQGRFEKDAQNPTRMDNLRVVIAGSIIIFDELHLHLCGRHELL